MKVFVNKVLRKIRIFGLRKKEKKILEKNYIMKSFILSSLKLIFLGRSNQFG